MGGKLLGFTDNELSTAVTSNQDRAWRSHQKPTKREKFLTKMEVMVRCQALIDLIKPQYPGKQERRHAFLSAGNDAEAPSSGTVVFPQGSSQGRGTDRGTNHASFCQHRLISDRIPDETTFLTFRHLLEKHGLDEKILETVNAHIAERSMSMRPGKIGSARLIAMISSNNNKEGKQDQEMH